jgi:signal transduction histidine kinase
MRRSSLAIVHKEIGRLNRLLTSLLDFARPRSPELQAVDAATLIDAIVNLAGHTAQQKGITLRKDVPQPPPAIECDPEQIKQVLLNLTINAVQSMDAPGEVVISARRNGSAVEIGVKDEGCGVSEEDLEKIFNPFFTTKDSGTGLGLSVAHQIVAQHGGAMRAERNAGRGMTFSVTLPLHARKTR